MSYFRSIGFSFLAKLETQNHTDSKYMLRINTVTGPWNKTSVFYSMNVRSTNGITYIIRMYACCARRMTVHAWHTIYITVIIQRPVCGIVARVLSRPFLPCRSSLPLKPLSPLLPRSSSLAGPSNGFCCTSSEKSAHSGIHQHFMLYLHN